MEILRNRESAVKAQRLRVALVLSTCVIVAAGIGGSIRGADEATGSAVPVFRQYCFQCHGKAAQMAGMNLEQLTSLGSVGDSFQQWEKVAAALEQNRMPPKGMAQPNDAQRRQVVSWIRSELNAYVKKHDGD